MISGANLNLSDRVIDSRCSSNTWRSLSQTEFRRWWREMENVRVQSASAWWSSRDSSHSGFDRFDGSRARSIENGHVPRDYKQIGDSAVTNQVSRVGSRTMYEENLYVHTYRFLQRRTSRRDSVKLVSDWTTQAVTLYTRRLRRRVHPGFLGLLNRYVYASRAARLSCTAMFQISS